MDGMTNSYCLDCHTLLSDADAFHMDLCPECRIMTEEEEEDGWCDDWSLTQKKF